MSIASPRPSALDRLNVFIGRWLTEGETVATPDAPSKRIVVSDVYAWVHHNRDAIRGSSHREHSRGGADVR